MLAYLLMNGKKVSRNLRRINVLICSHGGWGIIASWRSSLTILLGYCIYQSR